MVKTRILGAGAVLALLTISQSGAYAEAFAATSPTTACDALDSLDLATHTASQIDNRLSQSDPSNGLPLYTHRDFAETSDPWIPNPDSWTKKDTPIDFTGIAGYRSDESASVPNGIATLISPRHFVSASHYSPAKGNILGFLDADGNRIERTVVGGQGIGTTDIFVGVLDSDLPDLIAYYPIAASSALKPLIQKFDTGALDVPIVVFDQEAKAIVHVLTGASDTYIAHSPYTEGNRKDFSEDVVSGDSGNPGFIIIDTQPVLLFAHHGSNSGPNYGNYTNEIDSAMISLGGGHQVTQYNPTCFMTPPLNHLPIFGKYGGKLVLHTNTALQSVLRIYSATDADTEQTLSYSLASLTINSSASDPSHYFAIDSATGGLSIIASLDPSMIGKDIQLALKVEDNGQNIGSAIATVAIDVRDVLHQSKKIILDPDFKIPQVSPASMNDLAIDGDGKILAAGIFTGADGALRNGIARFDSEGNMDASFAPSFDNVAKSVFIDSSGKIVAGGRFSHRIARLHDDGSTDSDFEKNVGSGFAGGVVNKVIDVDGRILATGFALSRYNGVNVFGAAMIRHDGSLDTDFQNNFGGVNGTGNTLFFDGDDIYIGGSFTSYTFPDVSTAPAGRLIKVSKEGVFDTSFASNMGTGFDGQVRDITIRPDGKIVVVGDFLKFNGRDMNRIALLNPDGTLDEEFAENLATTDNNIFSVIAELDNKMIIGGNPFKINSTTFLGGIARLNADGSLDEEFNNALGDGLEGGVTHLVRRNDGALVAIGNLISYNGTALNNSIAILLPLEEELEEKEEAPAPPASTPAPLSGSSSGGGGGGGGGSSSGSSFGNGNGSAPAQSTTSTVGTVAGASIVATTTQGASIVANPTIPQTFAPTRNLYLGISGEDVRALQKYLNSKRFTVSLSGAGSLGNESTYFGAKTKAALAKFQKGAGIAPAAGFLGPLTRAYILSH